MTGVGEGGEEQVDKRLILSAPGDLRRSAFPQMVLRWIRTEVRVLFDDRYLYVAARMHDPAPDGIVSLLSRRDVRTQSEQLKLVIDSYHDRRTAYQFILMSITRVLLRCSSRNRSSTRLKKRFRAQDRFSYLSEDRPEKTLARSGHHRE